MTPYQNVCDPVFQAIQELIFTSHMYYLDKWVEHKHGIMISLHNDSVPICMWPCLPGYPRTNIYITFLELCTKVWPCILQVMLVKCHGSGLKVTLVKVKGQVGYAQPKDNDIGRWAHINVKLLHFLKTHCCTPKIFVHTQLLACSLPTRNKCQVSNTAITSRQ